MVTDDSFQTLFKAGRYAEILRGDLSTTVVCQMPDAMRQMRIAHIMVYADRNDDAERIIEFNLRRPEKPIEAYCQLLLGLIAKRNGAPDIAIRHFQAATHLARESNALGTAAWGYLHLFRLLTEMPSPQELPAVLAEARRLVTQVGDPHVASYLHESVARREAQMGRVHEARRHLNIAASILGKHPNAWMQQLLHMSGYCVAYLDCDFSTAFAEVVKARGLTTITGSSQHDPIIDANESHLQLYTGKLGLALPTLQRLSRHNRKMVQIGALDSLASLYLALNDLPACAEMINAVAIAGNDHSEFHNLRWAACTRLAMLARTDPTAALDQSMQHLQRAERNSDTALMIALLLIRVEALAKLGKLAECGSSLLRGSQRGALYYRDQRGNYYEACYEALAAAQEQEFAERFRRRAIRVWKADGAILPQVTVLSRYVSKLSVRNFSQSSVDELYAASVPAVPAANSVNPAFAVADAITSAFDLAEYPVLAAEELMTVAAAIGCDEYLVRRDGTRSKSQPAMLLALRGSPSTPIQSIGVASVLRIGEAVRTVARAREDERNRAALWPPEQISDSDSLFVSNEMTALAATARKVAPTTVPVLITGETGTGKEILARAIHAASTRAKAAFLPFNCSSGPRDMIDAQLFGHRRGAFTGATEHAPGVIRAAAGGTLFLDEIGESPLDVQPKLLRFLESGEIHPVGESHPTRVDVRIIAATNVDLDAAVSGGRFREDLFYRLNIVRLHLPPLRERRVEIPVFAHHYLRKYASELGKGDLRLAEETVEYLLLYKWPGNVRQLANEMRRMAALAETDAVLMPEHLSSDIVAARRTVPASERTLDSNELVVRLDQPLAAAAEHLERAMIPYALKQCDGRVEDAAQRLGLSRKGLYLKRMRLGLDAPAPQARTA